MTATDQRPLHLQLHRRDERRPLLVQLDHAEIASWTGRDAAATERRIQELEEMGIARPPAIPMLYPVSPARVTTAPHIEVIGTSTSGEAEVVLLAFEGAVWVGIGSDHTDRGLEKDDAALSKQVCDKPISRDFWLLDDIQDHWDQLQISSYALSKEDTRELYQDGSVAAMLHPAQLLELWKRAPATEPRLMFCGTLPTIGPIRHTSLFECVLRDPVADRSLKCAYSVKVLPSHFGNDRGADMPRTSG